MIDLTALTNMYEKPELTAQFGDKLLFDHPLAPLTTFNTGGKAKYFISLSNADQVRAVVSKAKELKLPFIIIGGGGESESDLDNLMDRISQRLNEGSQVMIRRDSVQAQEIAAAVNV